ncbi:MAG TPA: FecR family protein [Puia sp.]
MNDYQLYQLLKKEQQNQLTPEEQQLLDDWYNSLNFKPTRPLPVETMKTRVWSSIMARISPATDETSSSPVRPVRRMMLRYSAAAAILIAIAAAWLLSSPHHSSPAAIALTTVHVPHGGQEKLRLPDGTMIWLNGDATLDYPASFDTSRDVFLREGEAFFEVASDSKRPFVVHSQQLHTQVLGTSFDIRNYKGHYRVAVATGKVNVYYKDQHNTFQLSRLQAGEQLVTDSTGSLPVIDSLEKTLCNGWINRSYRLKDVSLAGIAYCMESIYGVSLHIRGDQLKKLRFTTSVSSKDKMKDILDRLSLAGDFHYYIDSPDSVTIYK